MAAAGGWTDGCWKVQTLTDLRSGRVLPLGQAAVVDFLESGRVGVDRLLRRE